MDILGKFLRDVCEPNGFPYEQVGDLGEIYTLQDSLPVLTCLVEWSSSLNCFMVNFAIGTASKDIGILTNLMSIVNPNLVFQDDFYVDPDYGYLYGEDATKAFIDKVKGKITDSNYEDALDKAVLISHEPIFTYGQKPFGKTKLEKIWEVDDYDL